MGDADVFRWAWWCLSAKCIRSMRNAVFLPKKLYSLSTPINEWNHVKWCQWRYNNGQIICTRSPILLFYRWIPIDNGENVHRKKPFQIEAKFAVKPSDTGKQQKWKGESENDATKSPSNMSHDKEMAHFNECFCFSVVHHWSIIVQFISKPSNTVFLSSSSTFIDIFLRSVLYSCLLACFVNVFRKRVDGK